MGSDMARNEIPGRRRDFRDHLWYDALHESLQPQERGTDLHTLALLIAAEARRDGTRAVLTNAKAMDRSSMSERTLRRRLEELAQRGLILKTERGGRSGDGTLRGNVYALTLPISTGQAARDDGRLIDTWFETTGAARPQTGPFARPISTGQHGVSTGHRSTSTGQAPACDVAPPEVLPPHPPSAQARGDSAARTSLEPEILTWLRDPGCWIDDFETSHAYDRGREAALALARNGIHPDHLGARSWAEFRGMVENPDGPHPNTIANRIAKLERDGEGDWPPHQSDTSGSDWPTTAAAAGTWESLSARQRPRVTAPLELTPDRQERAPA